MKSVFVALRPLLLLSAWVLLIALCPCDGVEAQTVFRYSFSDGTVLPDILDVGPEARDGVSQPLAVLSDDVPTDGVPEDAGNRSLDSSDLLAVRDNQSGVITNDVLLLSNADIAAAGGFTMECWFKWLGGGAVNSIIDYAGTEKIVIDQRAEKTTVVNMRIAGTGDIPIGDAVVGQWHYVAVVFDTEGLPLNGDGTISGTVTTYLDSLEPTNVFEGATKDTFGDSLIRPIGVGQHPIGFDLDFFVGQTFEPRVSLGPLEADDLLFGDEPVKKKDGFVRGDADASGAINITDGIFVLNFLFLGGADPTCKSAADADDSGSINITDGIYILNFLFLGGPDPASPHPACGLDPSEGDTTCDEFAPCV